jgi:LysR family transcriptional regulator, cys regulon transcriptional activator
MKLQQLRFLREVADRNLNITEAAEALHTAQPGVSKQIRLLEEELGITIFVRAGKRIVSITEPGQQVVRMARQVLDSAENLKRASKDFTSRDSGQLTIATTHTQASYVLPPIVTQFAKRYPKVRLSLKQGNPHQVAEMVLAGQADVGIATESLTGYKDLVSLPCYEWNRVVVAPKDHPILDTKKLTLARLGEEPIITYDPNFTGRSKIDQAFSNAGVAPNIVLTALDSDVIKRYVAIGLGVGIIASMAYDNAWDQQLGVLDCAHLFESSVTRIAFRRNGFLRVFHYDFVEMFAPKLNREVVEKAFDPN